MVFSLLSTKARFLLKPQKCINMYRTDNRVQIEYNNLNINMKVTAYETAGKMKAYQTNDQKGQMKSMMMQQGGMIQNKNNQ
jgi:hypothetical protein